MKFFTAAALFASVFALAAEATPTPTTGGAIPALLARGGSTKQTAKDCSSSEFYYEMRSCCLTKGGPKTTPKAPSGLSCPTGTRLLFFVILNASDAVCVQITTSTPARAAVYREPSPLRPQLPPALRRAGLGRKASSAARSPLRRLLRALPLSLNPMTRTRRRRSTAAATRTRLLLRLAPAISLPALSPSTVSRLVTMSGEFHQILLLRSVI